MRKCRRSSAKRRPGKHFWALNGRCVSPGNTALHWPAMIEQNPDSRVFAGEPWARRGIGGPLCREKRAGDAEPGAAV